ncbi:putative HAD superfamily protein [Helianthus anomalus]
MAATGVSLNSSCSRIYFTYPSRVLYVSGNALENCLRSENYVTIKPLIYEVEDTTLLDLIPFLEYVTCHSPTDIQPLLASYNGHDIAT